MLQDPFYILVVQGLCTGDFPIVCCIKTNPMFGNFSGVLAAGSPFDPTSRASRWLPPAPARVAGCT